MKICHVINCLKGGGAQNLVADLTIAMTKNGHAVSLIVLDDAAGLEYSNLLRRRLETNGVNVILLNRKAGSKFSLVSTFISLYKLLNIHQYDIINSHLELSHLLVGMAAIAVKSSNTHCITVHNAPEHWNFISRIVNKKKAVVFCSIMAEKLNNKYTDKYLTIPNGIDASRIQAVNPTGNDAVFLNKKITRILLVGSLRPQKNYRLLVEIAKLCEEMPVEFVVCGGSYGHGYESPLIFNNSKNINYLGLRSDVASIMNECHIFMSCSLFEGLPIAVIEALFAGLICVLSPIEQHMQFSCDIDDCFFPRKIDKEEYKVIITNIITNICGRNKKSIYEKRKEQILKYSITETANRYIQFYKLITKI